MNLNEKPTNLMESGEFKKPPQDDGRNSVAIDNGAGGNMEGGFYSEHEVQGKDNRFLQSKLNELEFQKVELERELKVLRQRNEELQLLVQSIEKDREANSEDKEGVLGRSRKSSMNTEKVESEEENILQLMIEISVLQCEKQSAEREVGVWKHKCKELESRLLTLQGRLGFADGNMSSAVNKDGGSCYLMSPDKPVNLKQGIEVINLDEDGSCRPSRRQLFCGADETNGEKTSPCTPAGARPRATFTVDTIDAAEKHNLPTADLPASGYQGYNVLTPFASKEAVPFSKEVSNMGEGDEDMSDCDEKISFAATPKRKRSLNVVTSDTESDDDDDNIPIGQLVRNNVQQSVPQPAVSESDDDSDFPTRRRHRLVKLSQYKGRKKTPETDESENGDDDDSDFPTRRRHRLVKLSQYKGRKKTPETDESENGDDDDNLESFIVSSSSDVSENLEESSDAAEDISDDSSDDFDGILHRIKRTKNHGSEWELEGDMLAAFGKDPILCMKAVCALYRQQTCDEQKSHSTFVANRRGFSTFDAQRGSDLAEFLTDKIPNGDVTKSVEQLNEFDPDGLEKCRALATRYSKQLFDIYQNEEDPHFFPP